MVEEDQGYGAFKLNLYRFMRPGGTHPLSAEGLDDIVRQHLIISERSVIEQVPWKANVATILKVMKEVPVITGSPLFLGS